MILNVRKSDGVVVDVDQKYDTRYYDNIIVLDGILGGAAAVSGTYTWDGTKPVKAGETIVELRARLKQELADALDVEGLKPIITELINRI